MTTRRYDTILARSRTLMASERTLMSYWRTALSFVAICVFMLKFFTGVFFYSMSALFLIVGASIFIFGTIKFYKYKARITRK